MRGSHGKAAGSKLSVWETTRGSIPLPSANIKITAMFVAGGENR